MNELAQELRLLRRGRGLYLGAITDVKHTRLLELMGCVAVEAHSRILESLAAMGDEREVAALRVAFRIDTSLPRLLNDSPTGEGRRSQFARSKGVDEAAVQDWENAALNELALRLGPERVVWDGFVDFTWYILNESLCLTAAVHERRNARFAGQSLDIAADHRMLSKEVTRYSEPEFPGTVFMITPEIKHLRRLLTLYVPTSMDVGNVYAVEGRSFAELVTSVGSVLHPRKIYLRTELYAGPMATYQREIISPVTDVYYALKYVPDINRRGPNYDRRIRDS